MHWVLVGLLITGLILSAFSANADDFLSEPEGITYDSLNNRYLIANWLDGSITQIDARYGLRDYFKTGLGYCADIHVVDDVVFVSCNNTTLMGFDLTTGSEVLSLHLSNQHLHGITSDTSGYLYVSDRINSIIYQVDLDDYSHSVFTSGAVYQPLGMTFDAANNRLVVVSRYEHEPIKAIALPKPTVTELTDHDLGWLDGITGDSRGLYYVSTIFNPFDRVYRFDSIFSTPPEMVLDSLAHIVALCYNREDEILAVTEAYADRIRFLEMLVSFGADTLIGHPSLEVSFSAESDSVITDWLWDFGDGQTGTGQNTVHTYTTAGAHDVTLRAITSANDTLRRIKEDYICVLTDSMLPDSAVFAAGDTLAELVINVVNNAPLTQIKIPVEYSGDIDLAFAGWSLAGCALEGIAEVSLSHSDPANKRLSLRLSTTGINYLSPGSSAALKLFFQPQSPPGFGGQVSISLAGYTSQAPTFSGPLGTYNPATATAPVIIQSCCLLRGDVDHSGELNISDVTSFVDFMFGVSEIECPVEADIDASGQLDVSDLTYLVEYLFGGGPAPTGC